MMDIHINILIVSFLFVVFKTVKFVHPLETNSVKSAMMVSINLLTIFIVIKIVVAEIITTLIYNSVSSVIHIALVVNIFFLLIKIKKSIILF